MAVVVVVAVAVAVADDDGDGGNGGGCMYTVVHKKTCHFYFFDNSGKC